MESILERAQARLTRIIYRKTAPMRSVLRAGIVGCGGIAPDHALQYDSSSRARLVAVSDVRAGSLASILDDWRFVRGYKRLEDMLRREQLDVVSVCTWPDSHAEIVSVLAKSGVKGILCEKPMALSVSEIDAMLVVAAQYGCKLAGGHQYRFHPVFMRAADIIARGELGAIRGGKGNIASSLANNGPHLVDTIRFLMRDTPIASVMCACERGRDAQDRGMAVETGSAGTLVFEDGHEFHIETGDRSPGFFSITVEGSRGVLEASPTSLTLNGTAVRTAAARECRGRQFGEFLQWVKGTRPDYSADATSSAETAKVVLALYEAARLGAVVRLPLTNRGDIIRQLYPGQAPPPAAPSATPRPAGGAVALASDGGERAVHGWFSNDPDIGVAEWLGVTKVLASKRLNAVSGHVVKAFERECADAYGTGRAVASTSGTAAIHVAIGAINPEPGDEIITSPVTDMGTVIPILMANCVPVFADIDGVTGNLTAASIERKITSKTKAVILVHLFGYPADLAPIQDLLRSRGIALIEDCAQAHFAEYAGRKVGTFGDFGCFSLQQSKQITCGDGGFTLVNRPEYAERAALFVDKGWDRAAGREHRFLGMNYRMTELQAAVARSQLHKLPGLIERRHSAATQLTDLLQPLAGVIQARTVPNGVRPAWWTYPLSVRLDQVDAVELCDELSAEGVRVIREYVREGVFGHRILREQHTYGTSRYPFSATEYVEPHAADYPGFEAFKDRLMFISWSHHVTPRHVTSIADAFHKVAAAMGLTAGRLTAGAGHADMVQPDVFEGVKVGR